MLQGQSSRWASDWRWNLCSGTRRSGNTGCGSVVDDTQDGQTASGRDGTSRSDPAISERYQKIFEYSNDAILIVDFETDRVVDANPAACKLLGYTKAQLLELRPSDIHPDYIEEVYEEFLTDVRTEGSRWTNEMQCLTNSANTIPTEVSGAVLETPGNEPPTQMIAIIRDISERVAHRESLEDKVTQLERFAQVISHDLRNPLNISQGRLELARETGQSEHFDAVEDALERMEELIAELLILAKGGATVGETSPISLDDIARGRGRTSRRQMPRSVSKPASGWRQTTHVYRNCSRIYSRMPSNLVDRLSKSLWGPSTRTTCPDSTLLTMGRGFRQ